jgi:hypothetical protein
MLEIQQTTIDKSCLLIFFASNKFNTEQKYGLHDDIVLKMYIYFSIIVLSRRIKGIEK